MAVPARAGSPNRENAASVQSGRPVSRFSCQPPIRPSRWICPSSAVSRSASVAICQVITTPSKNRAIRTSAIVPVAWPRPGCC